MSNRGQDLEVDLKIARIVRGPDQGLINVIVPNPDQETVKGPSLIALDLKVVTTDLDLKTGIARIGQDLKANVRNNQDLKVVIDLDPSPKTDAMIALDPSLKTNATIALDLKVAIDLVLSPMTEKMIALGPKADLDLSLDPNPMKIVQGPIPMIVSVVGQCQTLNLDQNRQVPKVQKVK